MGKYNFDEIINREGTNSVKYDLKTKFMPQAKSDSLSLWIADMDFACAPKIISSLHERIDRQIFGYSSEKTEDYYESVCGWFKRRFNWNIDKNSIFYSPGVVPAISSLVNILTKENEGIIIQKPVYYPFEAKIKNNNRIVVNCPLKFENDRYTMDYENFEKLAKEPSNKVFILCSPHNPVGRVWTVEELTKIVDICKKYDLWIISDEIHCDIIRKGYKHTPLEALCSDYKDKIITCTAPSKSFNLAGMQLSNIIINNKEIQQKWIDYNMNKLSITSPNPFAIVATKTAYNECEDWIDELNEYLDANIEFVDNFLKEKMPHVKMIPCEGTYLIWLDFRAYGLNGKELEEIMLNKANILLDEGYIFGDEGIGFERINIASPKSVIEECMNRIYEGFKEVPIKNKEIEALV